MDNRANGAGERRPGTDTGHLRQMLNFVQRNRLLVFLTPVVVVAATLAFVLVTTPTYDASTWIRVDEQRSSVPVLDALQTLSSADQIHTEMAVLRRRPLAEEVVDSMGLQVEVRSPRRVPRTDLIERVTASRDAPEGRYRLSRDDRGFRVRDLDADRELGHVPAGGEVRVPGALLELRPAASEHETIEFRVMAFHEAVRRFGETLEVTRPDRDAALIRIRYHAYDPVLVHDVSNAAGRYFIRARQAVRKTEARSTVEFLDEQIALLSGQLVAAENSLQAFREAHGIVNIEKEGEVSVGRFAQMRAERDMLDTEREALARMLGDARARTQEEADPLAPSPYRDLIAFPTLFSNFSVSELFRTMADVENRRSQLLNLRTPEDPDVRVLTERVHELERQLRNIATTYLEGLTQHVSTIDETLAAFRRELNAVPAREVQHARLLRQAQVLDEIYVLLQTRLKEAQIAAAVEDPTVRVVEHAVIPVDPIRPNKPLSLVLALLLGLGLGAGAAFLRESMDTTVHTREDLQAVAPGLPVLGLIPRIEGAAVNGGRALAPARAGRGVNDLAHRLIAGRDPRSPVSEAYRSMRTNLAFSTLDRPGRTLVFTSAMPGEGKSTSASNLAITLIQQGQRCLLVDADLRRGVLHEIFGEPRTPGFSDVIAGEVDITEAVRRIDLDESGTLEFLPTGTLPPNPAELLGSERGRALLARLGELYDVVVLDGPPLNLVTDAALLGAAADGVVVVARSGVTDRGAVSYALEQLAAVNAPVLGAVLNDIDVRKDRFYGSYGMVSYERYAADAAERVRQPR